MPAKIGKDVRNILALWFANSSLSWASRLIEEGFLEEDYADDPRLRIDFNGNRVLLRLPTRAGGTARYEIVIRRKY